MMKIKNQVLYRSNNKPIVYDLFFEDNTTAKPLVIFCHGYKGFKDWGAWDLVANAFAAEGLFFLKFNFSHNGGTVEDPIDFPDLEAFAENNYSKELNDLNDVIDLATQTDFYYANQIDTSNITLIGHSRGGGISILKTAQDDRITKLITWASVSDYSMRFGSKESIEEWKKNGVKYVINGRTKQNMPHHYQFYEDFQENADKLDIPNAVKTLSVPTLVIHAKGDDAVKFSEAEYIASLNPTITLLAIEGSNHVFDASHPWTQNELPEILALVTQNSINFIQQNEE